MKHKNPCFCLICKKDYLQKVINKLYIDLELPSKLRVNKNKKLIVEREKLKRGRKPKSITMPITNPIILKDFVEI